MAIKVIVDNSGSSNISVTVSRAGSPGLPGRTAYQYAVEAGYTGTEEQFAEDQANFASNATQVREDRDTTEGYKNESLGYKNDAEDARDEAESAKIISENASNIAVSAKNDAVSAKNDAEDAKIAAETAQGIAEGARDTAVSASNTAVSAKNDAVEAKGDAENAKTAAESARDTAVSAKNDAVSAKNDAESAKDTAVLAANTAVQAKDDALLAQSAAESARDTAVGARNEAVDARNEAVPAANAATSAKNDAEDARDIAVQAKEDAEAASNAAIQAKGDAELAAQAAEEDRDEAEQFRNEAEGYRDESEQFRDEAYYFAYLTGLGSPLWYGVQWDVTVAATELTRIGNLDMHRELPIQSRRRGCLLQDNGIVNYYLHPNDWTKKDNGTASLRDGSDGQVMVKQPRYWGRCETEGNFRRIKVSPFSLPGYKEIPTYYRGAYEAAVYRPENKLSSVANNTPDYRGGNNNAAWDGDDRSLLGVPASAISRTNFQAYARNRGTGWEMEPWWIYLSEWWLYLIEYANRNCQLPFTSSLTVDGFRQGGLGEGVTNLNSAAWNTWKSQYGFVPCGYTDELGIYTGVKSFELPAGYGSALTTHVPRWRGIENPFGHLWKWVNGINVLIQADSDGGKSYAYRSDNPANWSDSSNVDYRLIGEMARTNGYMTDVIFGEGGDLLPRVVGGSSATFWADNAYTAIPASGEDIRGIRVGGTSSIGVNSGFGCIAYNNSPASTNSTFGSRLCFLGA